MQPASASAVAQAMPGSSVLGLDLSRASLGIGALKLAAACERAEKAGRSEAAPSTAHAAVLLGDVKDALGEALEAAARAAYDLTLAGKRSAS